MIVFDSVLDPERLARLTKVSLSPLYRLLYPVEVQGAENIPLAGGAILAANHVSFFDTVVLLFSVQRRASFVGKAEYMDSWKTKYLFPALGMIPIERSAGRQAMAALDTAAGVLRRGGLLAIYPEGTRSRDGFLHRGHTGVAELALATGSPIVPIGLVGTDRMMVQNGIEVSALSGESNRLGDEGKTPLYAAIDGKLAAIIAVADPIKEGSLEAVQALHKLGFKVTMITGDNARTAQAIGRQLEIDDVLAEVLPQGKSAAIKSLQARGQKVAFVGDGINDAPALAQADVGLAIGTGTDIAIETADVILMSGDLRGVPNAIALSRATMTNIRLNLFWAFAYNIVLIPVAAGVLYPFLGWTLNPVLAGAAMGLSSVFVLTNALRLRGFKPSRVHTQSQHV